MANTYKNDPAKGLSKLQKSILLWIVETTKFDLEDNPKRTSKLMVTRPTFTEEEINLDQLNKRAFSKSNSASVSRALRRLEQRGLIDRIEQYGNPFHRLGQTTWIVLTREGRKVVKLLKNQNG